MNIFDECESFSVLNWCIRKLRTKTIFYVLRYVSSASAAILYTFCDIIAKGVSGKVPVFSIGLNLFMMSRHLQTNWNRSLLVIRPPSPKIHFMFWIWCDNVKKTIYKLWSGSLPYKRHISPFNVLISFVINALPIVFYASSFSSPTYTSNKLTNV